jgi:CBS domain-containing membrane protein
VSRRQRWTSRAFWPSDPTPVGLADRLKIALGAGLAIFFTGLAASGIMESSASLCMLASMGASTVILFAVPHSPMGSRWAVAGGHLLSGLIGVSCSRWIADPWLAAGLAVGLAVFAMHTTRCLHPPGGASALIPVLGGDGVKALGYQFLLLPLGLNVAVLLILAGVLRRRPKPPGSAAVPPAAPDADPPPLERLGIRADDLRAALRDINAFVDVSEGELTEIYNLAAYRAYRREFGEQTCARIMTRRVVTVEFATELEAAWTLMRTEGVKALPVVDRSRRVVGILTQTDFFRHARAEPLAGLGDRLRRLLRPTPGPTSSKPEVAGQIMTTPVVAVREDAPIADLVPLLAERGIHQVPVVDGRDKLVGLVTQSDLIAALYRNLDRDIFAEAGRPPSPATGAAENAPAPAPRPSRPSP